MVFLLQTSFKIVLQESLLLCQIDCIFVFLLAIAISVANMRSQFEISLTSDPLLHALNDFFHVADDFEKGLTAPTSSYLQDTKAMAGTAVDVKESPNCYTFCADMPGLARSDVQVQVENENVLTIRGKRKREEVEEGEKFLRMERRPAKFFRKFTLPSDANVEGISATCVDGVLTVKVPKLPPPEPEKLVH